MRAVVFLLAVMGGASVFAGRKTYQYTAVDGQITNTSCACAMCQRARSAAAAGQTKFCYGGKCYPISHFVTPKASSGVGNPSLRHVAPVTQRPAPVSETVVSEWVVMDRSSPARSPARSANEPKPKADPVTAFDPTPDVASGLMCALARVTDSDVVFDLGCGDGRHLERAAEVGATCVGVEINPATAKLARDRLKDRDNVSIVEGDLFEVDFGAADVVFLYLYEGMLAELQPRLAKLRPGTRVVSYCHDIKAACTNRHVIDGHVFYVWIVGADTDKPASVPDWLRGEQ